MNFQATITSNFKEPKQTNESVTKEELLEILIKLEKQGWQIARHFLLNGSINVFGVFNYCNGDFLSMKGYLTN